MVTVIYKDPYSNLLDRRKFKNKEDAIKFVKDLFTDYGEVYFEIEME